MKLRALSIICLFVLVAACTSSPQQYAVLVTATLSVESATPIRADTPPPPTHTPAPPQTNTPSLTTTSTPVPTNTPSPTTTSTPVPTNTSTPVPTKLPTATPTLLPPLRVEGARFMAGDHQVVMTGAVNINFVTQNIMRNPDNALLNAKQELDVLAKLGGNFVVIEWNAGKEYLGNPKYVQNLVEAIKYAKSKGFRRGACLAFKRNEHRE